MIGKAMKRKKFRGLMQEYVDEVSDPANREECARGASRKGVHAGGAPAAVVPGRLATGPVGSMGVHSPC